MATRTSRHEGWRVRANTAAIGGSSRSLLGFLSRKSVALRRRIRSGAAVTDAIRAAFIAQFGLPSGISFPIEHVFCAQGERFVAERDCTSEDMSVPEAPVSHTALLQKTMTGQRPALRFT